jgi:hypothetical protein
MVKFLRTHLIDILLIIVIIIPSAYLRITDLSYSDYIGDEQKSFIRLKEDENLYDFFMKQRKGPMQFLFSYAAFFVNGTYRDEAAIRLPYALVSVLSVVLFYIMVKKLTQSRVAGFFAALLLGSNGFFVGFGRIAQYQNLNLVFSFLSIIYAHDLIAKNKHYIRSSLLAVLFFTLSLFSHWDAVFIVPVLAAYFIQFLFRKDIEKKTKIVVYRNSILLGAILILPFMIPYSMHLLDSEANQTYLSRRVASGFSDINYYKFLIELYNPYVTFTFVGTLAALGALRFKKSWIYVLWFMFTFIIFWYFFRKPGTHIYNFVIPAIILASLTIDLLVKLLPKFLKIVPIIPLLGFIAFFYFQSYVFFVDHSLEYPWERKKLYVYPKNYLPKNNFIDEFAFYFLSQETPMYYDKPKLPLFGFPHGRYWNEINDFISEQNILRNENYGYHTNEDKSVSEWYMSAKYSDKNGFYGVGISKPTNFVPDWSYTKYGKSRVVVKEFGDKNVTVRIYRISPKIPSNSLVQ